MCMSDNTPPPEPPRPPGGSDTPPPPPPGAPPPPPPPSTPPGGGGQGDSSGGWGSPPPGGPSDPNGPSGWGTPPPPPPGGPGGYSSGPGGPGGPGGGYGGGPESYSVGNAFTYAFEKFKANWGPLVLITLVLIVVVVILNGVGQAILSAATNSSDGGLFGVATLLGFLFNALSIAVSLIVQAGIIKGGLALSRNEPLSVGTAFEGVNWGQVILAAIITGAMTFVGLVLCVLPGLAVIFFTSFTLFFVIDRDMPAIDAIKASFTMVKNNFGTLLLFFLATLAAYIVGACLLGIGLLAAIPIVVLAQVYTFRTLNGDPVQA